MTQPPLTFLKLGGSLITDKQQPLTAQSTTINRLVKEIRASLNEQPDLRLLIGHGSGSFVTRSPFNTKPRQVRKHRGIGRDLRLYGLLRVNSTK